MFPERGWGTAVWSATWLSEVGTAERCVAERLEPAGDCWVARGGGEQAHGPPARRAGTASGPRACGGEAGPRSGCAVPAGACCATLRTCPLGGYELGGGGEPLLPSCIPIFIVTRHGGSDLELLENRRQSDRLLTVDC